MQFTGLAGQKDKKPRGGGQNPGTKRNRRPTDVARSMASRNNRWGVEQPRLIELDSKYQQREKVGAARLDAAEHVISSLQQPYALAKKLNLITFWLKDWDDVLPPEVLNQDLLDPDSMVSQAEANAIAVLKEKRKLDSTPEPFGKDPSINKASQTLPIKAPHVSHWEDYRADPAPPRQVSANKRPDPLPSVVPVPPVLSRNERIEPPSCIPVLPEKSAKKIVRPSKHAPLSVSLRSTAPASDLEQENCQLDKLEFSIQFAFLIARLDGTLSPSAKKLIHDYFQEQYASEAALANRVKAYCVHLERGPIKFENGIGQFHKLFTADERSRLISLGGQIIQASDRENKKAVALLQKMAGDLKSSLVLENAAVKTPEPPPDSPQPLATQPLATQCTPLATSKDDYLRILEIDPSLTISADFVRRQFNHVCGKYAPERAVSLDREFVELFDKKREEIKIAEIKIAATALLQELGEELESTTSSQPKALRENPDLDKEFGVGSMSLYDDISLTDSDRKTKEVFGDQVVVKSLSQHNVFHGLPRFVSEYLIAKYVRPESWKEDLAKVQAKIRDLLPDLDRRELIKERLLSAGEVTLIDNVEVRVDLRNGQRWGRIPAINDERIRVSGSIVETHPGLLLGGMWGTAQIRYIPEVDAGAPNELIGFTPFQVNLPDIAAYRSSRSQFTTDEWISLMLQSAGYAAQAIPSRRHRLFLLARLVPLVEKNVNLVELGPRQTGKTFLLRNVSPRVFTLSGGKATPANLFFNQAKSALGILGTRKVVVFDEIAHTTFGDEEATVSILKDYMESGQFSRGNKSFATDASLVFVGNLEVEDNQPEPRYRHLFEPLPDQLIDSAFLDRIHGYLPGWEIPKITPEHLAQGVGFVTDYFGEVLVKLREDDFQESVRELDFSAGFTKRDQVAVERIASGFIKLIFPDGKMTKEELLEVVSLSCEMRQRVHNQLTEIAPGEFKPRMIACTGIIEHEAADLRKTKETVAQDDHLNREAVIGAVTGLAVIQKDGVPVSGGLSLIQVSAFSRDHRGRAGLEVTGLHGKILEDSVKTAYTIVRTRFREFEINEKRLQDQRVAVHLVRIAEPKDGPSAGIAFVVGIVSALTGRPVKPACALTGEVTLHGGVLGVGGIAYKVKAAVKAGRKTVIIPAENAKDISQIPDEVLSQVEIIPVRTIEEALHRVLGEPTERPEPQPISTTSSPPG